MSIKKKKIKKEEPKTLKAMQAYVENQVAEILKEMALPTMSWRVSYQKHVSFDYLEYGEGVLFAIKSSARYKRFNIIFTKYALDAFQQKQYDVVKDGLIHELCHIHTEGMYKIAVERYATKREVNDTNEELTETMAQYVRAMIYYKNKPTTNLHTKKHLKN